MQYGYDQTMLNACIWPLAINDSVCTLHPDVSTSQLCLLFNNDVQITKIVLFCSWRTIATAANDTMGQQPSPLSGKAQSTWVK